MGCGGWLPGPGRRRQLPGNQPLHRLLPSRDPTTIDDLGWVAGVCCTRRRRPDIERFFAGFDLVDPGLVWIPQWRPDWATGLDPYRSGILAAAGRKPVADTSSGATDPGGKPTRLRQETQPAPGHRAAANRPAHHTPPTPRRSRVDH